ncbi:MAG TPA: hypothetical protein VFA52_01945 [Candidatus Paceibacterota bacterium]|nr:hypothetical protein [Candidatus Paceibacterota bacterium]
MTQLTFFFVWPVSLHIDLADKVMVARRTRYGNIKVYRNTTLGVWVVTYQKPVFGPSGRIGCSILCIYPQLFFSGRSAWTCAKNLQVGYAHQTAEDFFQSLSGWWG